MKRLRKPVTLADIAASAAVTSMTVSRVMNSSGYVHAETRERVLRVAREMNYRRNGLARGLKRQRTETIGLVIGDIANPFAAKARPSAVQREWEPNLALRQAQDKGSGKTNPKPA